MTSVNKIENWSDVRTLFMDRFDDDDPTVDSILFVIGLQELGKDAAKYTKNEKMDILHIAICTLLMKYGIYKFIGRDEDGWPHFERTMKLPHLKGKEQENLIKDAILEYFQE